MQKSVNLLELCQKMVEKIQGLPETERYTKDYKHAYQFEGEGIDPFYLQVDHGHLVVHPGVLTGDLNLRSVIRTDASTLRDVFVGKTKPLDAADQGKWSVRARNYSGNLLLVLIRIGQEKVIEELLSKL